MVQPAILINFICQYNKTVMCFGYWCRFVLKKFLSNVICYRAGQDLYFIIFDYSFMMVWGLMLCLFSYFSDMYSCGHGRGVY